MINSKTWFERAVFLSWYCSIGDCTFCYMSTQKKLISEPRKARRKTESILAEIIITKLCGWKIEFISGGIESYTKEERLELIKKIHKIYGKVWLNIGVLDSEELKILKPYVEGICGAIECVNPKIRKKNCPSKPIDEITKMFNTCNELGLKKSMTLIIGLGESVSDFVLLKDFIVKHKIKKITFYRLNPHKGTSFKKGPKSAYYAEWIKRTRKEFPSLEIIAGSWVDKLDEIPLLLKAGADALTKFPAIKLFNTKYAKKIEELSKSAGREFTGTMTKLPEIDIDKEVDKYNFDAVLAKRIKYKLQNYFSKMKKNEIKIPIAPMGGVF